jgi:predicted dehydrogenase
MSDPRVRWGLVSTALINEKIIAAAQASGRVDILGVASRTDARAAEYARNHGIERSYGRYAAMFADPDIEAVYISTPNDSHVSLTMEALAAGKHVLVEKPFTRHGDEAVAAAETARAAGLILSEAFMWRHTPQTRRVVELLQSGTIGRVVAVRAAFCFNLAETRGLDDTRNRADLDGGAMMDVGCYCLSGIRLLSGAEPERVSAEQFVGPGGVDMLMTVTMRMTNGVLGLFDCGFSSPLRHQLEALGDEGSLYVGDPFLQKAPGIAIRRPGGVEHIALDPVDPYQCEMENLSDAIRGTAPLGLGPDDAVAQARGIEAIYRAAESGASVTLTR